MYFVSVQKSDTSVFLVFLVCPTKVVALQDVPGTLLLFDDMSKQDRADKKYKRMNPLQHIHKRSETYIGSTDETTSRYMVVTKNGSGKLHMVDREITHVPGLVKIFDEILVNAVDNKTRDPTTTFIKVVIDKDRGEISVANDGRTVPICWHSEEQMYVPELVFGQLLTSDNFDDDDIKERTTGGRNGYGAKLTNAFSSSFSVACTDAETRQRYTQTWTAGMTQVSPPVIKDLPPKWSGVSSTKVTFTPDLARFHMSSLTDDVVDLMIRRVYDVAGTTIAPTAPIAPTIAPTIASTASTAPTDVRQSSARLKVSLNNSRIKLSSFAAYAKMFLVHDDCPGRSTALAYQRLSDKWEVCVGLSGGGGLAHLSFVNNIHTPHGGAHVDCVATAVAKIVQQSLRSKRKSCDAKLAQIKAQLFVFVNCRVDKPKFDSQMKSRLTTTRSQVEATLPPFSSTFRTQLSKVGVSGAVVALHAKQDAKHLAKTDGTKRGRVRGVDKLDDANDAGGRNAHKCTLILTEGDSAKAMAVSGIGRDGRDRFGVFPLKGKPLNVRGASTQAILNNAELGKLKKILGLKQGHVYEDVRSLRYGRVMIMTDQDLDGSHIKGLVINMFATMWPSLLKIPGFLQAFVTPLVKVTKRGKSAQSVSFRTIHEFNTWVNTNDQGRGWSIKYYKGLGTSTTAEAKQYFADLNNHVVSFRAAREQDMDAIDLAFQKARVGGRKEWIQTLAPDTYLDQNVNWLSFSDFVHKDLVLYSVASCKRAIPSIMDGLKPGQRKILFSCFKRNLREDVKVAQLAGYVSEQAAYHHGEASLTDTITRMAQTFVGSNNVNYLVPSGQFGTRHMGGKDSASPRYTFTRLAQITRALFPVADDVLLAYPRIEGNSAEPTWYAPVIPLVLVNGRSGMGTGWSTSIPSYNPLDVIHNLRRMLHRDAEACEPMCPWYRGFRGSIVANHTTTQAFEVRGCVQKTSDTTLSIFELPVGIWTANYKTLLNRMIEHNELMSFTEHHGDEQIQFDITCTESQMNRLESSGIHKALKLTSKLSTSNMMLYTSEGVLTKFESACEIMRAFYDARLPLYGNRKQAMILDAERACTKLRNERRFIASVISGELVLHNRKHSELEEELVRHGFDRWGAKPSDGPTFDYLWGMSISSFREDKRDALKQKHDALSCQLLQYKRTTPQQMWLSDLRNVEAALRTIGIFDVEGEEHKRIPVAGDLIITSPSRKRSRKTVSS